MIPFINPQTTGFTGIKTPVGVSNDKNKVDTKEQPTTKTVLKTIGKSTINISKVLLSVGILSYVIAKTPVAAKFVNEVYRANDLQPNPVTKPLNNFKYINGVQVDSFVGNYKDFHKIEEAINKTKINVLDLDKNNNSIVFDKPIEIKELITQLKQIDENQYNEEIKLLEEINITSQLIWGPNGPNPYSTQQGAKPNCQIMAAIQGQGFNENNIQNIKGKIRITAFNPSKENFRLDTVIELNNKISIQLPFEDLITWMSSKGGISSSSSDEALYVPILASALEEGLRPYTGVPNDFSSAPVTLLTGNNYYTVLTSSLSDNELINILSQAPQNPVHISTRCNSQKQEENNSISLRNSPIGNVLDFINLSKPGTTKNTIPEQPSTYSKYITKFYTNRIKNITENIMNDLPTAPPLSNRKNKMAATYTAPEHLYTVKDFKNINGKYIVTIIDSYDDEIDLTLDELRNHSDRIVAEAKNIPNFSTESYKAQLFAFALISAILIGAYKVNKKIDPDYKSTTLATINKIFKSAETAKVQ